MLSTNICASPALRVLSTAVNGEHTLKTVPSGGLSAIETPNDVTSLGVVVDMEPARAKAAHGAETPSPKTLEAFPLAEGDFDEEQQSQSAHDHDLVDMILTR